MGNIKSNFKKIINELNEQPLSINLLSKKTKLNWRTCSEYLNILKELNLVTEKPLKNTKTFYVKDINNYFYLPIKNKDKQLITTIYHHISKTTQSKTKAYKILWMINEEFKLHLPIGFYLYGPCPVQIYTGKENNASALKKDIIKKIDQYSKKSTDELIKETYNSSKLHNLKERLLVSTDKKETNSILMELVLQTPNEAQELVTDFARTVMLIGWNEQTKELFPQVWKYLATIIYKDTLTYYTAEQKQIYFEDIIKKLEKDAQEPITTMVKAFVKKKYPQVDRWPPSLKTQKSALYLE